MDLTLEDWWPRYNEIVKLFGYDQSRDQYATDLLSVLLAKKAMDTAKLKKIISKRPVLVFGAGPSLEENLRQICNTNLLLKCVSISADGATSGLLKVVSKVPDVIVTDLDGDIRDILAANKLGAVVVIHGHGDNIEMLKKHVPDFRRVIGTTQLEPRPNVYNFCGFTDGDRAVFLAAAMGAKLIALAGMDFGNIIGEYSKKHVASPRVKRQKLKIGKELLEWFASKARAHIELFNITGHGQSIEGFRNFTATDLQKLV